VGGISVHYFAKTSEFARATGEFRGFAGKTKKNHANCRRNGPEFVSPLAIPIWFGKSSLRWTITADSPGFSSIDRIAGCEAASALSRG
jgi:hypothetical protein